ncbi:hypothetical protein EIP86_010850 [Pleurotus ostreatoroseus]|nr:hypothetical protein EIP86_010850 [Pleurotus ostreatoroseus]
MTPTTEDVKCITEFATLEVTPPFTLSSPQIQNFLRKVAHGQESWSHHPVLFYQDALNSKVIYLISGWESISAHDAWIASEENQLLLKEASLLLSVKALAHISINFNNVPKDAEKLVGWYIHGDHGGDIPSEDLSSATESSQGWKVTGRVIDDSLLVARDMSPSTELELKGRKTSGTSTPKTPKTPKRSRESSPQPAKLTNSQKSRKRRKEKRRSGTDTPKASSSRNQEQDAALGSLEHPIPVEEETSAPAEESAFVEDYIAFTFSDGEKENDTEDKAADAKPAREWDKGKGKGRDYDGLGRKRKADEMDRDNYASRRERYSTSRRAPWAVDVDWERGNNVADLLHREVEAFVKYISPTPVEDEIRSLIVQAISNAITKAFPDARVMPFGSYETKLYLPLGDIDLVIESQSMAYNDKTTVLYALANTVKRAGITDKVSIIAKAKVPIIKFVTRHGRFPVDISINQINGVAAGQMVKRFLAELPALRGLVLIIKSFLSQRSMNEVFTGGLGSYSIVCLAISFLQMHPKIRRGEMDPSKNLGVLVMELFELYGCYFNYHEVGISVRDGGSYYNKAERGWADYRAPGLLSIEDPGDPSNDISRGSYNIAKVRTTFAGAFSIMTAKAYNHANIISARRERRYVHLQSRSDPEELSILGSVMGVTQETINQRRLVQEVYDQRVLHRILGVEPTVPTVSSGPFTDKRNGRKRSREGAESVKSAWEEADMELSTSDDDKRSANEEESRYDIETRLPPKKRMRKGTKIDTHIYISDDDDDAGDGDVDDTALVVHTLQDSDDDRAVVADNDSEQEAAYDTGGSDGEAAAPDGRAERKQRTRSFWLSKGIAMTTARTPAPVNLKDRIAALQQRSNASAHGDGLSTVSLGSGSLKDKIASFERKGAVPTPRGRFGASAPPAGDSSTKKKGELYGNRVPELAKPSPDAALATRRRTISSNSRSLSRPTSPESDPASGSDPVPPLPSVAQVGRRIVSDVGPRTNTSAMASSSNLQEVSAQETVVKTSPPAIVVQTDYKPSVSRASPTKSQGFEISSQCKDVNAPNGGTSPAPSIKSQDTIKATSPTKAKTQESPQDKPSERAASQPSTDGTSSPIHAEKPTSISLSRSTSSSDSDIRDDVTASSESVPTPSDDVSFPISDSPKVEKPSITLPAASRPVMAVEEPLIKEPPRTIPVSAAISPPAPAASPIVSVPPDSPGIVKVERKVTPSFHAVVHRKVREVGPQESAPVMPPPSRVPLVQPKTPAITRVRAESVAEPQSPGLGDLAALVFNAALLEEQLSGTSTPAKKPIAPPAFTMEPAIPEDSVPDVAKPSLVEEEQLPKVPDALVLNEREDPTPKVVNPPVAEERPLPPPPAPAPAPEPVMPSRRESVPTPPRVVTTRDPFPIRDSSLRQSMPLRLRNHSVSRNSVYSEMSEESHVMVSRPSSPPGGSDASSVRSSSKSWKSPKKGIGRASSWLFRNKSKSSVTVPEETTSSSDIPPSPSLLSPYPSRSMSGSTSSQPGSLRASSRMSISSGGSAEMFDPELVSSFPSVPTGHVPPHLRSHTLPPMPPLPAEHSQPVGRALTVGHASGRQQQQRLL